MGAIVAGRERYAKASSTEYYNKTGNIFEVTKSTRHHILENTTTKIVESKKWNVRKIILEILKATSLTKQINNQNIKESQIEEDFGKEKIPKFEKGNFRIDFGLSNEEKETLPLLDTTNNVRKGLRARRQEIDLENAKETKDGFLKMKVNSNVGPIIVIRKRTFWRGSFIWEYQKCPNMPEELVGEQLYEEETTLKLIYGEELLGKNDNKFKHHLQKRLPDIRDTYRKQYQDNPEKFLEDNAIKFTGGFFPESYEFNGIGEYMLCYFGGPVGGYSGNEIVMIDKNGINKTYHHKDTGVSLRLYKKNWLKN